MSVPCEFLALVREHILGHHRDNPALTTSERSLYGSTTCTYGELLDRAVELKETLICLAGEAQPDGSPNNEAASNVVICGDSALHAVATLACSFAGFVAVYIPYEATIGETVSRALAVQRASQASAIVFNDQVWRDFKEQMMKRCASVRVLRFLSTS
jgi:acyl-CoA synthetase (AMP-forming)/AMP-acid ligase II